MKEFIEKVGPPFHITQLPQMDTNVATTKITLNEPIGEWREEAEDLIVESILSEVIQRGVEESDIEGEIFLDLRECELGEISKKIYETILQTQLDLVISNWQVYNHILIFPNGKIGRSPRLLPNFAGNFGGKSYFVDKGMNDNRDSKIILTEKIPIQIVDAKSNNTGGQVEFTLRYKIQMSYYKIIKIVSSDNSRYLKELNLYNRLDKINKII